MKLTIASKVTILRICLIPLFILSYYFFDGPGGLILPTLIFVVAAMTDWIDGHLARSRNEVTNFGKFIDPIADKLLVTNFPFRFIGLPMDKVAEVVAVVFTIWSGVDYIVKNRQVLREKE